LAATLLCCLVPLLGGCPSATTPASFARQYLSALATGKTRTAWELLEPDAQRALPFAEFERRIAALSPKQRAGLGTQAELLGEAGTVAEWTLPEGRLRLAERNGRWVVVGPLPAMDRVDTPQHALRTFARAFRASDYRTMLSLVPAAERDGLTERKLAESFGEVTLKSTVERALTALLTAGGGKAEGAAGWRFESGRHRADFIREGTRWHLRDLR
jgi:hypothetical protein